MKKIKQLLMFLTLFQCASFVQAQDVAPIKIICSEDGKLSFRVPITSTTNFNPTVFNFGVGDPRNGSFAATPAFSIFGFKAWVFDIPCTQVSDLNFQITLGDATTFIFINGLLCSACTSLTDTCPTSLLCGGDGNLALQLSPNLPAGVFINPITVFLGSGNPDNGIYIRTGKERNDEPATMNGPPCNASTLLGQVTLLVDQQVCIYENGVLTTNTTCEPFGSYYIDNGSIDQDCINFFEHCLPDLISLIDDNASALPCRQWDESYGSGCSTLSDLYRSSGISIGTSGSSNSKLTVKDGIITDKVKVESCGALGWCDYVFEEGYPLPTLEQVAAFIEKNKRLPNIPSGSTLEKEEGFDLKEITLLHQEKIEEIYLYMIALEKEADRLESVMAAEKTSK